MVSDNYVRRNLKGKGSCRWRQQRLRPKSQKFGTSLDQQSLAVCTDSSSHDFHQDVISRGISGLGLDPLQLSMDAISLDKSCESTNDFKYRLSTNAKTIAGKDRTRCRGKVSISKKEFEEPICSGHGHIAALLTVKKPGPNKVINSLHVSESSLLLYLIGQKIFWMHISSWRKMFLLHVGRGYMNF